MMDIQPKRLPDITVHANGRIDIHANAAKLLRIGAGNAIGLHIGNGEACLYVLETPPFARFEGTVYPTNKGRRTHNFRTYSKRIASALMRLSGLEPPLRLPVGEPVTSPSGRLELPIIMRNLV